MKKTLFTFACSFSTLLIFSQRAGKDHVCNLGVEINSNFSRASRVDSVIRAYSPEFLPGVSVAVYSASEGWWADAAGYANKENNLAMDNCHLQYLQSITKSYM